MLDAGIRLEDSRAEVVRSLRATVPTDWTPEQLAVLKEGMQASTGGIPLKRVYGSDFPYRETEQHLAAAYQGVGLRPSLAMGGLSNVWGAAMLPYADQDLASWPIRVADLAEHYAAVLKFTGLSARHDGLERILPLYGDPASALQRSRQAQLLLDKLEQNQALLARAGIHFGQARVAVQAAGPGGSAGCVYCGLCMYGCPYGYIYSSADTLRRLQRDPRFSYQPDIIVTAVRESGSSVAIEGYNRLTREPINTEAQRVYLAAGVIPTTHILLRSRALFDQAVWMKDSQYFLLPLALTRNAGAVRKESLHTLSQLFIEILDQDISPHSVHLQIYSYNDLIGQAVSKMFGPLARPLDFLVRVLENRLLIVQGYLHSDHSPRIGVVLKKGAAGGDSLELTAQPNPQTRPIIKRVVRKLLRHARQLGAVALPPMLQIAEPGRGFHSGGTFPLRRDPAALETDLLGRPQGWQRVHAVDATVLPSIPATTITFSAMANAHRIGWESANLA
jgi:choline dehydrogenase-like flavoprotein